MEASGAPEARAGSISAAIIAHTATGAAPAAAGNSTPISRSPPILRKSGSLTPTQVPAPNSSSCSSSREDERRRDFQRVKTVSFANLDNVNEGDACPAAAAIPVPEHPVEPERLALDANELERGRILTDEETDRQSLASAAWARCAQSCNSSNSSTSFLYLPLGSRLRHVCGCCYCAGVYSWFRKLGPGNDLAFHTREDLQLEQQQKRHTRMASRSSTMSSGSGAVRSSSMRGGSSPEKHMRSFPLAYTNKELEELFALNVNHWMRLRLLPMGVLLLLLTFAMWPLLAWSFDQQSAFDHRGAIGIMFNTAMAVTVLAAVALSAAACVSAARNYAEHFTNLAVLLLVTMWGVWNSVASYRLETQNERHYDFGSTEESTALEACTAMSYLYGLLPVVLIDVVLPSRTKYTWFIHVSFFGTSAASIIIRGILNARFIAPSFVVIRVVTYFILALFLFLGRYAAEMHLRQTFLGWLDTRRRVDRLESDLKRQRSRGGASTSVEQLVHLVKQMQECNQLALAATDGMRQDVRTQLQESKAMLEQCLSILCTTTNLYAVNFGPLDNIEHMDIIRALLNDKNALPKDWARARDSLPSSIAASSGTDQGGRRESNGEYNNSISSPECRLSEERQQAVSGGEGVVPVLPIVRKRTGEGTRPQQGLQLLPLPRSRRGSQSGENDPSNPQEELGERCSNRSSVLSEMLQRPRRVSRAAHGDRSTGGDDKLLKVAYLFSPNQAVRQQGFTA